MPTSMVFEPSVSVPSNSVAKPVALTGEIHLFKILIGRRTHIISLSSQFAAAPSR